jgi:hypothetical protein
MIRFVLSPTLGYLLLLMSVLLTFVVFDREVITTNNYLEYYILLVTIIFFVITLAIQTKFKFNNFKLRDVRPYAINNMVFVIIIANISEYFILGVPLLSTDVSYHTFGLPYVHHISVSSWLLLFAIRLTNRKIFNVFLLLFALLNPIFMQNRDILLLTVYVGVVLLTINNKLSFFKLFLIAFSILLLFGKLGMIRSPLGLELALESLPLSIEYDTESILFPFYWFLIYFTGSIFNSLYLMAGNYIIYYENINAISEFMGWYRDVGFFGFIAFEASLLSILIISLMLATKNSKFLAIYVYLNFQVIMTLFSKKVFLTNTLFTIAFILIFYLLWFFSRKRSNIFSTSLFVRSVSMLNDFKNKAIQLFKDKP